MCQVKMRYLRLMENFPLILPPRLLTPTFRYYQEREGTLPVDASGNSLSYIAAAPVPLYGRGAPPLKKVLMTSHPTTQTTLRKHRKAVVTRPPSAKRRRTVRKKASPSASQPDDLEPQVKCKAFSTRFAL